MALSTVQIKKALKDRKLVYRDVAERAGLDPSIIAKNVNKVPGCRSARARQAIAEAIEQPVEVVYGEAA